MDRLLQEASDPTLLFILGGLLLYLRELPDSVGKRLRKKGVQVEAAGTGRIRLALKRIEAVWWFACLNCLLYALSGLSMSLGAISASLVYGAWSSGKWVAGFSLLVTTLLTLYGIAALRQSLKLTIVLGDAVTGNLGSVAVVSEERKA